jgi:hypothetical protein
MDEFSFAGDVFFEWCKQYGNTYYLSLVSEDRVREHPVGGLACEIDSSLDQIFTFEPEHIKVRLQF